ncbi:MAG: glycosylhydrolase-like jelly roll fold domain-containing protein, partial [Bacteroidota bacterium]
EIWWDQRSSILDPFLKIINNYVKPDFGIDFAYEDIRKNKGLTFIHRKTENQDIYFVSNIQDRNISYDIDFRVSNKEVWNWNPYNGEIKQLFNFSKSANGTKVPIKLAPWESTFIVFEQDIQTSYVNKTNMNKITGLNNRVVSAEIIHNGSYYLNIVNNLEDIFITKDIEDIPAPLLINGKWKITFESEHFPKIEKEVNNLSSWSDTPDTKYFSGTGVYEITFNLPDDYIKKDLKLELDLGKIGNIGEVFVNGKNAGVIWMKGQKCNVTNLVRKGKNQLTVLVTNTNINRVSAFSGITPLPDDMLNKYGKDHPDNRYPREFGFEPLPPSGLMGPVKICPVRILKIDINN